MEENETKQEEELFIPKTKYKGLKILLGIILIAGLIVGGYFLYQYKFNNPKTIISNVLEDARNELKANIRKDTNGIYKLNGHVKIDSNLSQEIIEGIDIIKDIQIQFDGEMDYNNSLINMNINTKYKNDKLIDFKAYYEKDAIYLFLNGLYDKYLKSEVTKTGVLSSESKLEIDIKPDDIETIANAFINALKKEMNELELKQEKTKINIDGEEVNVINNYIEFKDKELNEFVKNIIKYLSEDQELSNIIKRLTDTNSKTIFDELINGIGSEQFNGKYKINFYTDNSIFKKKLVSVRQTITQDGITTTFDVDKISDDEIKLSIGAMGMIYSAKIKKTNSVMNININFNIMGSYLNIEINTNYEPIKEFTKIDVSNNKNINDLTEEEKNTILNKLQDNKALLKLIDKINNVNKNEA